MTKVTIENSGAVAVDQLVKDIEEGTYFFGVIGTRTRNLYVRIWRHIVSVSEPSNTWGVDDTFRITGYQPVKEVIITAKT